MLSTPYGQTSFYSYVPVGSEGSPHAANGLRVRYPDGSSAVLESQPGNSSNSYFWDRNATAQYPSDPGNQVYSHCLNTKWTAEYLGGFSTQGPVMQSLKPALDNEIDFTYANGITDTTFYFLDPAPGSFNKPTKVSTSTTGGTQNWVYTYNTLGKPTSAVDPVGRKFTAAYAANNIDLTEIRETNGYDNNWIGMCTYDSYHNPLTYIDASGAETQYTYNSYEELETITDACGKVTTLTYSGSPPVFLTQIDGPMPGSDDITTFTYDGYNRVATVTDSEGYTLTYSYDNMNRVTQVAFPDGTTEQAVYDRLDAVQMKDRIGRWSTRSFDSLDRVAFDMDPLGRKTAYCWCICGALQSLTDPAGNITSWAHDLEGRVTSKTFPDGSDTSYTYDSIGRLATRTDAREKETTYSYYLDNTISEMSYSDSTPDVSYTYDSVFPRLSTAENSWGTYTYGYSTYNGSVLLSQIPTTGDYVNLFITNSSTLPDGAPLQYQVGTLGSDTTLTLLAESIVTAISSDMTLSSAGISATPSGAFITVSGSSGTTTVFPSTNGVVYETLGGSSTLQPNDQVSITVNDPQLGGGATTYTYTVTGTEGTLAAVAGYLAGLFSLTSYGITASTSGNAVVLTSTSNFQTTYTQQVTTTASSFDPAITITQSGGPTENAGLTVGNLGGNRLTSISNNAISNATINFTYDALGRTTNRSIGSSNSDSLTYDAMSRVTAETNALSPSPWAYNYVDNVSGYSKGTTRLASIDYPNSQVTNFSYYGNTGDQRLQQISNLNPSSTILSQFTHQYDSASEMTLWQKQQLGNNEFHNFSYDQAGQLISSQVGSGSALAPFAKQNYYNHDCASNRTGAQSTILQTARIGGSKTTGDTLTLTVNDPKLSGGTESVTYNVLSTDTLSSICAGLAAAVTADTNLSALGVNAVSASSTMYIKSTSPNISTFASSVGSGATESFTLGVVGNGVTNVTVGGTKTTGNVLTITVIDPALTGGSKSDSYTVLSTDSNLAAIATGLKNAINGDSSLSAIGVTAATAGAVVNISSTSSNATTFTTSVGSGATETLSQAPDLNSNQTVVIGGTKTTGDVLTIHVYDLGLSGGTEAVAYMVLSGDSLSSITSAISSAISADTNLQAIGVSATSSGTVMAIQSNSVNITSYASSESTSPAATETIKFPVAVNGTQTALVTGTKTTGDTVTITVYDSGLSGGSQAVTYTVLSGDTIQTAAAGVASAINANSNLSTLGVTATSVATSVAAVVNIKSASLNNTSYRATTNSGATETVAIGNATEVTQSTFNDLNELTGLMPGGAVRILGNSDNGIGISSGFVNAQSSTVTIGDPTGITPGDVLWLLVHDSGLVQAESIKYTVQSGNTLSSIAASLTSDINADPILANLGVTATSAGPVISIFSTSVNGTRYSQTVNTGATETITIGASASAPTCENSSLAFTGNPQLDSGVNIASIAAVNGSSTTTAKTYSINLSSGASPATLTYDAAGNVTNDGTNSYSWDAENRLIEIIYPGSGNTTQFTYDPFSRCVEMVEAGSTPPVTGNATKQFVWNGGQRCEERDSSGNVVKQFFPLGQVNYVSGTPTSYFYELDHRGDVVGVDSIVSGSFAQVASFGYDPYGNQTALSGSFLPDCSFAGLYQHGRSGLSLATYRAYNPSSGRWINRDPIGEAGGINLYVYVGNNPISGVDPSGLDYDPIEPSNNVDWSAPGAEAAYIAGPFIKAGRLIGISDNPPQGAQYQENATQGLYGAMAGVGVEGAMMGAAGAKVAGGSAGAGASCPVKNTAKAMEDFLGPGYTVVPPGPRGGSDLHLRSADGLRHIRFDLVNSHGMAPHINVEQWTPRNLYPGDRGMINVFNEHATPKQP